MFSLSSKGTCGIAAILELAAKYGTGPVELLNGLLKVDLVRSVRGNKPPLPKGTGY